MAVISPLNPLINKNFGRTDVDSSKQSITKVSDIIKRNKKEKSIIFSKKLIFRRKRLEYERRAQLEDELEANKFRSNINLVSPLKTAQAVGGGIFKRIINTIAYLGAGWILKNAPTWIAMGKEFIARVQQTGLILKGFVSNVSNIFFQFGNLLSSVGQNIIQFDFFDSTQRVSNSFNELLGTIDNMGSKIEELFNIFTTPLSEGKYSGENVPPVGSNAPSETYERPVFNESSNGNVGPWGPLLKLIASKESGGNYEAMAPGRTLPGATKMTIAEVANRATGAVGKYQQLPQYLVGRAKAAGLNPNKDLYSPANQDLIAAKVNIGMNRGGNQWLQGKITDEQFMQRLSMEFAVLPNAQGKFYHKKQGSSITPAQVKGALNQVKSGSSQPQPSQQQSQPSPSISTPQNFRGTFIQGSTGRSTGPHFHFGPGPANAKVAQQGNIFPGKYYSDVREVAFNVAKYFLRQKKGFLLSRSRRDIGPGISDSELKNAIFEEQRTHTIRGSDGGIDMAFTGNPVLPLAVSDVKDYNDGFGISGTITGKNVFVGHGLRGSKSSSGTNVISSVRETPKISTVSREMELLTLERKGQSVFIIDQILPSSSPTPTSRLSMPILQSPQTNESDMLNNFIRNKFLLDLAYL